MNVSEVEKLTFNCVSRCAYSGRRLKGPSLGRVIGVGWLS
jgi:hypothetical protein